MPRPSPSSNAQAIIAQHDASGCDVLHCFWHALRHAAAPKKSIPSRLAHAWRGSCRCPARLETRFFPRFFHCSCSEEGVIAGSKLDPPNDRRPGELMAAMPKASRGGGDPVSIPGKLMLSASLRPYERSRTVALPKSANRQRATMQTRQGLDATHGGELFPVAATRVDSTPTSSGAWPFRLKVRNPDGSRPVGRCRAEE